jgi:hypothetical protein
MVAKLATMTAEFVVVAGAGAVVPLDPTISGPGRGGLEARRVGR